MSAFRNLFFLFIPLFISCGGSNAGDTAQPDDKAVAEADTFMTMTPVQARHLYENADKVDVLFTDVAVSLSQVKQSDVQGQIGFMSPGPVPKKLNCSESANIIYQANGEIIGDGHMYLRGDCKYVVFYEDSKPAYAAYMTAQGMKFYGQILSAGTPTLEQ